MLGHLRRWRARESDGIAHVVEVLGFSLNQDGSNFNAQSLAHMDGLQAPGFQSLRIKTEQNQQLMKRSSRGATVRKEVFSNGGARPFPEAGAKLRHDKTPAPIRRIRRLVKPREVAVPQERTRNAGVFERVCFQGWAATAWSARNYLVKLFGDQLSRAAEQPAFQNS